MASSSVHVNGFTIIRCKVNESSDVCRHIYLSEHKLRTTEANKPLGRTLFILNIPPFCNEECLRRLFGDAGAIESVIIQDKPLSKPDANDETSSANQTDKTDFFKKLHINHGYKVAYLVYKKKSSVRSALEMSYTEIRILYPHNTSIPDVGMNKWFNEYISSTAPPDAEALQQSIDKYMTEYDAKQAQKIKEELRKEEEPDEEGWVTVSRYGKKGALPRTEAHQISVQMKDKKRNKDKELLHFYAYQIRETKKEYVAQLRQKFEEDKQKIALMRAARKFKPY